MAIDTTKIIAEVSVDNVNMQLKAPTGTIDITENGEYDVINYATANVNVSGGSSTNKFAQLVDRSITEVTADDLAGVTSIGNYAFSNCSGLTTIEISSGVTSIGTGVFQNCNHLTTITIPNSVKSIGNSAFYNCSNLTSITIPNSVTSIGISTFSGCTQLTGQSINSESNVKYLGYTNGSNFVPTVTYNVTDKAALSGEYTIPNTCKVIYDSAFKDCGSLTSITIPNSVTSIGQYAFSDCSNLSSIIIPKSVTSIGTSTFSGCSSLSSITIPESIISIRNNAFRDCSGLTSVIYEGQAPDILSYTFTNCSSIQLYDFRNCTTVPQLANTSTLGHKSGCQIIVPDELYEEWQQATNWSSLRNVVWVKSSEYVEG